MAPESLANVTHASSAPPRRRSDLEVRMTRAAWGTTDRLGEERHTARPVAAVPGRSWTSARLRWLLPSSYRCPAHVAVPRGSECISRCVKTWEQASKRRGLPGGLMRASGRLPCKRAVTRLGRARATATRAMKRCLAPPVRPSCITTRSPLPPQPFTRHSTAASRSTDRATRTSTAAACLHLCLPPPHSRAMVSLRRAEHLHLARLTLAAVEQDGHARRGHEAAACAHQRHRRRRHAPAQGRRLAPRRRHRCLLPGRRRRPPRRGGAGRLQGGEGEEAAPREGVRGVCR
jgi:hypothetical protein